MVRKSIQDSFLTLKATLQSKTISATFTNSPTTVHHHHPLPVKTAPLTTSQHKVLLPWTQSIVPDKHLTYMNLFEQQLQLVKSLGMVEVPLPEKFIHQTSSIKPAQIGNVCYQNEVFRKVRMTYFDAGDNVQVFNSLWYPHYDYDIPMLGIDLISLGRSRVLTVIDFQPLYPTEEYAEKNINHLSSIKQKYPDLQGVMSGKIYDDTSFFSKNMLFGRFADESKIQSVVKPALEEYLREYVQLAKSAKPVSDEKSRMEVLQRQKAYDVYSALKDPAVGLFDAYFGKEWSREFVHEYLFSLTNDGHHHNPNHVHIASQGKDEEKPVHTFNINQETGEVSVVSAAAQARHQHMHKQ